MEMRGGRGFQKIAKKVAHIIWMAPHKQIFCKKKINYWDLPGLASRARAMIPAAMAELALVPLKLSERIIDHSKELSINDVYSWGL